MVCLEALETLSLDWKYALNAAGSELQLPNNRQLVELLSQNPGSVVVNSEPMPAKHMGRVRKKYELRGTQTFDPNIALSTFPVVATGLADPVPFNMTVFKGRKSFQLPREFVQFLLTHPVAKVCKHSSIH